MIDVQIRELLADGLSPELEPLTAGELELRASSQVRRSDHRLLLVAACVACLAVLAGGLAMLRTDSTETATNAPSGEVPAPPEGVEAPGTKVGRYFVPSALPNGFVLLGVDERAALPGETSPSQALYTNVTGDRVALRTVPIDGRWSTSDNTTELDVGIVRWSRFDVLRAEPVVTFQIDRGNLLIDGEAVGIDEAALTQLFNATSTNAAGVPIVDDDSYTLTTSSESGTPALVADFAAFYGPPGGYFGMAGIEIRIEKYAGPVDPELEAGVWNNRVTTNGRTIMLGLFDSLPWWMPSDDTIVRVQASGNIGSLTAQEVLAFSTEIGDAAIAEAVGGIAGTAATLEPAETLAFGDGVTVDLYGPEGDARGLCLTAGGQRRCDLALMLRSTYTSDERQATTQLELLIDQRWYTVGLTQDATALDTSAQVAEGANGTWFLIRHPDDAATTQPGSGTELRRPSR